MIRTSQWGERVNRFFIYVLGACYLHWKRMDSINVVFCVCINLNEPIGMVYNLVAFSISMERNIHLPYLYNFIQKVQKPKQFHSVSHIMNGTSFNKLRVCACVCMYRRDTCIHIIAVYQTDSLRKTATQIQRDFYHFIISFSNQ